MINRPLLAGVLALMSLSAVAQQAATPAANNPVLSLGEIESRLTAEGIKIDEIDLRDSVVEVEGRDAEGREVELLVDRRTGEILSRKLDRD
jgi:uncharacterized membrane protein YkoI